MNTAVGLLDINVDSDNDGGAFSSGALIANGVTINSNNDLSIDGSITATAPAGGTSGVGIQITTVDSALESESITIEAGVTLTTTGTGADIVISSGDDVMVAADSDIDSADNITINGDTGGILDGGATIEIRGELTAVSLNINGNVGADILRIVESAGNNLPSLSGTAAGSHTNTAFDNLVAETALTPANVGTHFESGGGGDSLVMTYSNSHNVTYFSDTVSVGQANSGVITVASSLTMSFDGLAPMTQNGAGGTFTLDATSTSATTTISVDDDGVVGNGYNRITADGGVETTTFGGFDNLIVRGGTGSETITLVNADGAAPVGAGQQPLTSILLDGDDSLGAGATGTDTAGDTLNIRAVPATIAVTMLGGAGDDMFLLESDGNNNAAAGTVNGILGAVIVSPAADEFGGNDTLTIIDTDDSDGDAITVTDTTIEGITGNTGGTDITYGGSGAIETINIWTSNAAANGDTVNVQRTQSGSVYTLNTQAGGDTINVSSDAGTNTGNLNSIGGQLNVNSGADVDALVLSDSGDAAADTYILSLAGTATGIAFSNGAFVGADVQFNVSAADQLEHFSLLLGSGDDTVTTVGGSRLAANMLATTSNTFSGNDGNDTFTFEWSASFSLPAAMVFIINGGNDGMAVAERDRVNLTTDADTAGRTLGFTYGTGAGEVDITGLHVAGGLLEINTAEQLVYTGDVNNNDTLTVNGTTGADVISVTPLSATSANVFLDGMPQIVPGVTLNNDPGIAGGGTRPDLNLNGLIGGQSSGLTIVGGGGDDRLVVNAPTENIGGAQNEAAWDATVAGGVGSVVRTTPGEGYDVISAVADATAGALGRVDIRNGFVVPTGTNDLLRVNFNIASFMGTSAQDVIINTGEEADPTPGTLADDITVTLSTTIGFQINGGAPTPAGGVLRGDRLNIAALVGGTIDIYSDLADPPNVSITSTVGLVASQPVASNNIELTTLIPGNANGVVNVIGDNNSGTAQNDEFLFFGARTSMAHCPAAISMAATSFIC